MGLLESLKKYFRETDESDNEDFTEHILEVYEPLEEEPILEQVNSQPVEEEDQAITIEEPVVVEDIQRDRAFGLPPDKEAMFQQILKDIQNIKE